MENLTDELINNEIMKLRKEIYDLHEPLLSQKYNTDVYKFSWNYFSAAPLISSFNRKSLDMLVEACERAKIWLEGTG